MLPVGKIGLRSGDAERDCGLSRDEQVLMLTAWT